MKLSSVVSGISKRRGKKSATPKEEVIDLSSACEDHSYDDLNDIHTTVEYSEPFGAEETPADEQFRSDDAREEVTSADSMSGECSGDEESALEVEDAAFEIVAGCVVEVMDPGDQETGLDFSYSAFQDQVAGSMDEATKRFLEQAKSGSLLEMDTSTREELARAFPSAAKIDCDPRIEADSSCNEEFSPQAAPVQIDQPSQQMNDLQHQYNRRRDNRRELCLPVIVKGYDQDRGEWEEESETIDVSRFGIVLRISKRMKHSMIVHLSLPLPSELRSYDHSESDYRVYAIVRRVEAAIKGMRIIALEFIGQHPPIGYIEEPWACFQSNKWSGRERRKEPREERNDIVWIEYLDEAMQCISREVTRTEDLSSTGMRVSVKSAPPDFEVARVSYPSRSLEICAVVCNRYKDKDGLERLCLQFLDNAWHVNSLRAQKGADEWVQMETPFEEQKRILLAEDDPVLRKVLGRMLKEAGYELIMADDGKSAVEKATRESPDLVLTDALMPHMHGFMVCKAVKELPNPPAVIILTGVYVNPVYRRETQTKYGADAMVTKPFEISQLLALIKDLVTNRVRSLKPQEQLSMVNA